MATAQENLLRFQEISNRGLQDQLPPDKRAIFDEALTRGLITAQQQPQQDPSLLERGISLAGEAAAGANRGILGLGDIALSPINVGLQAAGQERIPPLSGLAGQPGDIAGPGLPTEIASAAGEVAAGGLGAGTALRAGAKFLAPKVAGESAALGTARQLGSTTPGLEVAGGAGAGAGGELGEEVGGETGKVIGGIAGGVASGGAVPLGKAAIKALTTKLGKNVNLINPETGLPSPQLEKALTRKGLDFGSIVDDVDDLPVIRGNQTADQVVDTIIKRKIKSGAKDNALATIKLKQGKIVADELGEEAVKQGFRAGDVAAAKGSTPATKKEMSRMLNMSRQIMADTSKSQQFRPSDVVGDQVLQRFTFIRQKANSLRADLDRIAKKGVREDATRIEGPGSFRGLKDLNVNVAKIEDNIFSELERLGISSTGSPPKLNFVGSDIAKDKTSQRIIKNVVDLVGEGGSDALRAHKLKRQLDAMIDFNKKSAQGLTEAGRSFAKSVRRSLNESIREVHPQYAKVNDELSQSIEAMNNFQQAIGGTIDVFSPNANQAVGTVMRRLLGNAVSRQNIGNSLNSLDDTARVLGADFKVNVRDLNQFANTLDDRFGAAARTSFKGDIESAGRLAARGKSGAQDFLFQKGAQKLEELRGVNDKSAFNAMSRILKRLTE